MNTNHPYLVFDTDDAKFANGLYLNVTSKAHVIRVCSIQAHNASMNDATRANYARQAGLLRENPDAIIPDIYDSYTVAAALAQALFKGCPPILDHTGDILDRELFLALNEGEVNRAFYDFQRARSGTSTAPLN